MKDNLLIEALLCLWFVLVGFVFWSPYLGISVPPGMSTALYGGFLLLFIAALTLRLLRGNREEAAGSDGERTRHRGA